MKDDMFTLFEAMSAIEMMDPKMDAGMMCNRVSRLVLSFQESIDAGVIRISDLTLEEMVGIVDDTTCCIIAWLEGHSLAQTVFTNLYLHNPLKIEDKCIKWFSLLILKLVDFCLQFIQKAEVYEEEDFQPSLYNYRLDFDVSESKICSMVREVEDELNKRVKAIHRKNNQKQHLSVQSQVSAIPLSTSSNGLNCQEEREVILTQALMARLKFYRCLLSSFSLIMREITTSSKEDSKSRNLSPSNGFPVTDIAKYFQACIENVDIWAETGNLGVLPKERVNEKITTNSDVRPDYPTVMGFEPLINQRLLPPTFPRYTKLKSRAECISKMENLARRLLLSLKVRDINCFHAALDFFADFSRFHGGTCVLSRSLLQLIYVPSTTTSHSRDQFTEKLKDALVKFDRPPTLVKTALLNGTKQAVEAFMAQSLRPMMCLLQILGHNRARQREKLAQVLEELSAFQAEAENVDTFLNQVTTSAEPPISHLGYFSTWVLYHVLRSMIQYVLSGFELELYSSHEYPYIFWYLYEFLYGWLISTMTRAATLSLESKTVVESMTKVKNAKKAKNKKKMKERPHAREILIAQAMHHLTGGLFKAVLALKLEGRLKEPTPGVSSEKLRYEHRFMPFYGVVTPSVVSYEQYQEMIQQSRQICSIQPPRELYSTACRYFEDSRRLFESVTDPNEEVCKNCLHRKIC